VTYLRLNNNDELFMNLRDLCINSVGPYLQDRSRNIRDLYKARPTTDGTVKDIQDFVKKIPHLKRSFESIQHHIRLTEQVTKISTSKVFHTQWQVERQMMEEKNKVEYIEDCIARHVPLATVIRLLCLQSIIAGGFKERQYNSLRTLIIHTYGFEVLLSLQNLQKLGLFRIRGSKDPMAEFQWTKTKQDMQLIYNEVKNDDIAYVTSGYAPILARLVQWALDNRWGDYRETIKRLPGPMLEVQRGAGARDRRAAGARSQRETDGKRKVVLVYVLGGITFMEISALRFLSKREECAYEIVIATTKLINGQSLTGKFKSILMTRLRVYSRGLN